MADLITLINGDEKVTRTRFNQTIEEANQLLQDKASISLDNVDIPVMDWQETSMPAQSGWRSICYGGGKFVAVGDQGAAAYSAGGMAWTTMDILAGKHWQSVCYGNGKFVAIGTDGTVAYSDDGVAWETLALPVSQNWQSVCYGNGSFVAVGHGVSDSAQSALAYSADGVTWTTSTLPVTQNWLSVCYGGGKFVAVGYSTSGGQSASAYSADGVTWIASTLPVGQGGASVCYGDGKYITVGYNFTITDTSTIIDGTASYSADGITWTALTVPDGQAWYAVCYGDGKFVAVDYEYGAAYSVDGVTWTAVAMPSAHGWMSVCYGAGKFVAVAYNSIAAAYLNTGSHIKTELRGCGFAVLDDVNFVAREAVAEAAAVQTKITWRIETLLSGMLNWEPGQPDQGYAYQQDISVPDVTVSGHGLVRVTPKAGDDTTNWIGYGIKVLPIGQDGYLRFGADSMPGVDVNVIIEIIV